MKYERAEIYVLKGRKIYVGVHGSNFIIPGGKLEPGEKPIAAAERETLEEIGIKVKDINHLATVELKDKEGKNYINHSYKATYIKFDKKIWGDGPEGKFYPSLLDIPKVLNHFRMKLNAANIWERNKAPHTIAMLKLL